MINTISSRVLLGPFEKKYRKFDIVKGFCYSIYSISIPFILNLSLSLKVAATFSVTSYKCERSFSYLAKRISYSFNNNV